MYSRSCNQGHEEEESICIDSFTVAIYKGKGDPLQCGKDRDLRIHEHGTKILRRFWIVG